MRGFEARAEQLPAALRAIALDYIRFLQALAQQRTLLERHCYVVLPDQRAEIPAVSLGVGCAPFSDSDSIRSESRS